VKEGLGGNHWLHRLRTNARTMILMSISCPVVVIGCFGRVGFEGGDSTSAKVTNLDY
jgi:hypothetical protein